MSISNYPNGFANGVTIRGVPIAIPNPGQVFWVNNSSVLAPGGKGGSNGNDGSYQKPFLTVDYAIGRCTADRGDVIYVMPGHNEIVSTASGIDFDVNGVTVIGLGSGTKQPKFNCTATTSTVTVAADNVTIRNIKFRASTSAVARGVDINAIDTVIDGCTFDVQVTATDEFNAAIALGVGCDRTIITNNIIDMGLGGAVAAIKLFGASDGATIDNNRIVGDYSVANINGITTLSTEVYITNNLLLNGGSANIGAQPVIEMLTATTGVVAKNLFICNVATFAAQAVADTMIFSENFRTEDIDSAKTSATTAVSVTVSADD